MVWFVRFLGTQRRVEPPRFIVLPVAVQIDVHQSRNQHVSGPATRRRPRRLGVGSSAGGKRIQCGRPSSGTTHFGEPLAHYEYHKWRRDLRVTVFLLRVTGVEDHWQEALVRQRTWATAEEARQLIDRSQQLDLLEAAIARLESE